MPSSARIKFYVINLDRSPKRLRCISSHLRSLGIEFTGIAAVDGRQISNETARSYPVRYFRPLTKGELGCALSHYRCWERIIEDGVDYGVILEDDAMLDKSFLEFIKLLKQNKEPDWDILKLTQYFKTAPRSFHKEESADNFRIRELRRRSAVILKRMGRFYFIRFHTPAIGTYGQIVTKKAAAHLVKYFVPKRPLDIDMKYLWDMYGLTILSLYPPVLLMESHPSTLSDKLKEPRRPMRRLFFQLCFTLRLFRYNCSQLGLKRALLLETGKSIDLTR